MGVESEEGCRVYKISNGGAQWCQYVDLEVARDKAGCQLAFAPLCSFVGKVKILRKAKILKGSKAFVSVDFTKED